MFVEPSLFVEPGGRDGLPADQLVFGEPEGDFGGSGFDRIGTMNDIAANADAKITANCAGDRGERVGRADHQTSCGNDALAFPDHRRERTGGDEFDQSLEEGTLPMDGVVALGQFLGGLDELEADERKALGFEAADDFANEVALDAIGLDGNECTFHEDSPTLSFG